MPSSATFALMALVACVQLTSLQLARSAADATCFGVKPVSCRYLGKIYTCSWLGCVNYGDTLVRDSAGSSATMGGMYGWPQYMDDGRGMLVPMCVPIGAMCQGEPIPNAIPKSEMRPI